MKLVRLARRRLLQNELLSQGANAASAALLAFILLLLLGTQVLSWRWLVLIPLAAAFVGLYLASRRLPSPYVVAQIVDHRLDLADSISTALFFSRDAATDRGSAEMRRLQYERADLLSQSIDVRKAVPYTVPRSLYLAGALVLVASSLFALRYGLNRRLDLRPPLASMLQQTFGFNQQRDEAKASPKKLPPDSQAPQEPNGDAIEDQAQQNGDRPDDAANSADEANEAGARSEDSKKSANDSKKQGDEGAKADSDDESTGDDRTGDEGDDAGSQQGDGKQDQKPDSAAKQDANGSNENSSLMSKVKDAVQNLLSRMKPQQGQQGSQQSVPDQKGNQGKSQQNGNKQQSAKNGQQQNGGQQGDTQEGDAGEQAQNQQDSQGKGTGKSDTPQPSKQPGSGIGSQDGDKSIKQAEQLAAMGKISEILGKRSATVTGESTVEVQNTSQQLHTPYAQRGVQHSQGGAEINRDEVPVALQSYVEQYFEQVRKQAAPPGVPAKK